MKHSTGTREEWLAARVELLKAEKELTRQSDALAEQLCVDRGMVHHERRAEARREGRGGFGHAELGAGDDRRVAGEEVIHGLLGRET